eukprot:7708142-Ditylum_brightwellii.AAC.1
MKSKERRAWISEWNTTARMVEEHLGDISRMKYWLPILPVGENQCTYKICEHGLKNLLQIGSKLWNSGKLTPHKQHGNTGKYGNKSSRGLGYREICTSLDDIFKQKNKEAAPFALRLIREETELLTRDDNPDNVVLPPLQ